MESYQGCIFDLDGVLANTAVYHYLAWRKLAGEEGLRFDEDLNEKLKGIGRLDSLDLILRANARDCSPEEKEIMAARKNSYYQRMLKNITPDDLLPGVLPLLQGLAGLEIKLAVASASRNAPEVISNLRIGSYFEHIVDIEQIKRGKPDPDIFLTAAKHLGLEPAGCVGIEDSMAGIRAIKTANMLAIGIGNPDTVTEADLFFADLTDYDKILVLFNH